MRRSAISVVSNIAEGYARQTGKEFVKYLYISISPNAEFQSQLYLAFDLIYINKDELEKLTLKA